MSSPQYIKTDEVHSQLNKLIEKRSNLVSKETRLKLELDNIKTELAETKKNLKTTSKQIEDHKIVLDGFRHACLECGYVQDIIEDIKPTPINETKTQTSTPI